MRQRAWYLGPVALDVIISGPELTAPLIDYVGGIMDTLDGSHGPTFTYLPIVYEDDCQVCAGFHRFRQAETISYVVRVTFLNGEDSKQQAE